MTEKRSLFSAPETFSLSPLLALLPARGTIGSLSKLTTSLYARYEKVSALKKAMGAQPPGEAGRRVNAEEAMLKQVLDWLAVGTDEIGHS